jgi:hypothetical protein
MRQQLFEEKVITYQGAKHYLNRSLGEEHWKHHRYDGPAIVPIKGQSSEWPKSYYLFGYKYTPDDYEEIMKEREGVPFYKTAAGRLGSKV